MTAILKMERYIQGFLDLMLQQLKKRADRGDVVNMADRTSAFAYDVVGELAYGEQLGHLRSETDVMDLRQAISDGFFLMGSMSHMWRQMLLIKSVVTSALTNALSFLNPFNAFQK
jgi:hypothetical protein